jgi:hypothetical protein
VRSSWLVAVRKSQRMGSVDGVPPGALGLASSAFRAATALIVSSVRQRPTSRSTSGAAVGKLVDVGLEVAVRRGHGSQADQRRFAPAPAADGSGRHS